ncbi:MAG: endolytic transglycosylase MltG [Gammaproteobacteria bacterium]|nr:MAG: endolytic transglycosylase MltG [Gammaproteobacteria bacterium]
MRLAFRIALLLLLLAAAAWIGLRSYETHWLAAPIAALDSPRIIVIPAGASLTAVAHDLQRRGLLDQPWIWIRHAKRQGVTTRIRSGEYELQPGLSPQRLLQRLVAGEVLLHALTIPEGWTFRQAVTLIRRHPAVAPDAGEVPAMELAGRAVAGGRYPEGLFFPDTYRFPRGTSARAILQLAHGRLEQQLAAAWERRDPDLPLATPYEALILASLIEKETGAPGERAIIAGVFVNRLRLGMRLQTDPSVIYGLGDAWDGRLRHRDLEADTPYNSYTRSGLPPTPIALPGHAALDAAVRPAATDALYFVATGLGDGRHFFARTLGEHNANVARYLANLRARSGDQVR